MVREIVLSLCEDLQNQLKVMKLQYGKSSMLQRGRADISGFLLLNCSLNEIKCFTKQFWDHSFCISAPIKDHQPFPSCSSWWSFFIRSFVFPADSALRLFQSARQILSGKDRDSVYVPSRVGTQFSVRRRRAERTDTHCNRRFRLPSRTRLYQPAYRP